MEVFQTVSEMQCPSCGKSNLLLDTYFDEFHCLDCNFRFSINEVGTQDASQHSTGGSNEHNKQ